MSYQVLLRAPARTDLGHLSRDVQRRITKALEALRDDPRPAGTGGLTGVLKGLRKLRAGSYRIAYAVDDSERIIRVWAIGHRQGFYDRLRRRRH